MADRQSIDKITGRKIGISGKEGSFGGSKTRLEFIVPNNFDFLLLRNPEEVPVPRRTLRLN